MIDGLLDEVKNEQDELLVKDDAQNEVRRRIQMGGPLYGRSKSANVWPWLAAAAALVASGAALWAMRPTAPLTYAIESDQLRSSDGFVSARERARIAFSDGSRIDLGAASTARVVDVTDLGAGVALTHGRLHAEIHHTDGTHWNVFAGPYAVTVTGTKFDVSWSELDGKLDVRVSEGSVRVSGSCMPDALALRSGDNVSLHCERVATLLGQPATPAIATSNAAPIREDIAAVTRPDLRAAANTEPTTGNTRNEHEPMADQIARAEQAATSGNVVEARTLLIYVHEHAAHTAEGSLAAFLLGRLAFDAQSDFAEAARWFETYEQSSPNGPLIREAMGRHLEALVRMHRSDDASTVAARYLQRFPDGPHAALARQHQR